MVWLKLIFFILISFSLKAENTQNIHDTYFNFLDLNNDGYVSHEEIEQIKNINTTLLLEPDNEEAMFILIKYELKKSNYSKVNELKESFILICNKLCNEKKNIEKSLKDIEPKNESQ